MYRFPSKKIRNQGAAMRLRIHSKARMDSRDTRLTRRWLKSSKPRFVTSKLLGKIEEATYISNWFFRREDAKSAKKQYNIFAAHTPKIRHSTDIYLTLIGENFGEKRSTLQVCMQHLHLFVFFKRHADCCDKKIRLSRDLNCKRPYPPPSPFSVQSKYSAVQSKY